MDVCSECGEVTSTRGARAQEAQRLRERLATETQWAKKYRGYLDTACNVIIVKFKERGVLYKEVPRYLEAAFRRAEEAERERDDWKVAKKESDDVIKTINAIVPRDVAKEDLVTAIRRRLSRLAEAQEALREIVAHPMAYSIMGRPDLGLPAIPSCQDIARAALPKEKPAPRPPRHRNA